MLEAGDVLGGSESDAWFACRVLPWRRFHSGDREQRAWLLCAAPDKSFQVTEYVVQPDGVMVNSGACEQTATKRPEDRFRSKLNQTSKCVITIGSVEGIRCLFLPKM